MRDTPFDKARLFLGRAMQKPSFLLGLTILGGSLALAIFPGFFSPYDPNYIDYTAVRQAPSFAHPFGTDMLGRDSLSRVIWAYPIDLQIAFFATVFAMSFGTIIGALVGYYRGWADVIFGRIVDAVITFPFIVLVIAVVAVLGPGLLNMYVAISLVGWVYYARLMRAEVISQSANDYVAAGYVLGYSDRRILFRHIVPNAFTPVLVYWMTDMALAILLGSSLGYLGLGAQPPQSEWGVLIADGRNFITTSWWMSLMPGIAIVVTGLGFSLLGDALADLLRPKG
ncbi:ABC transporter permease [Pelagibacterium sp.]|uniref:ABC transporter permease n=1 Tax=Pelagibacterium sp. TaxID=1967288 RepID=UPI003A912373